MGKKHNFIRLMSLIFMSFIFLSGCAALSTVNISDELPVLKNDELIRPYSKLGRIQVVREVIGADFALTPDIMAWGLSAVKQEAFKMGADAIIAPEVSGRSTAYGLLPSTEYIASCIAIKFK